MIRGVDTSSVQGLIQVDRLDAIGCKFLIHKCQQGNDGKDPFFERNVAAARAAGWRVGAYHFMYPLPHLDPRAQAEKFYAASPLGENSGDIPPALDLEWPAPEEWVDPKGRWVCTAQQISDFSKACVERVTELYGRKPLIYIYPYFAAKLRAGADISWLAEYPLWIASYGQSKPAVPAPWKTWSVWQYDGNGGERMPNGGDSDFNWFNGDDEALAEFCRIARGEREEETGSGGIVHPPVEFEPHMPYDVDIDGNPKG